jgi:beta-phosphoglucomutase-like phosphatase (HAD superfamily)
MPAAALFDFDGTLIDREPLIADAVVLLLERHGIEPPDGSLVIGRAWQDVHADLGVASGLGWSVADLVDATRVVAAELVAAGRDPRVLTGGADLIARLAGRGVPVAIVSGSTRAELDDGIEVLGVGAHLAFHLGAEDYGRGKPHPECFLAAADRLGAEPSRCVVFEDSTVGVAAGLAAGMKVIATADANQPEGHPAWQDHGGAHAVVATLAEVTDDLLAEVLAS